MCVKKRVYMQMCALVCYSDFSGLSGIYLFLRSNHIFSSLPLFPTISLLSTSLLLSHHPPTISLSLLHPDCSYGASLGVSFLFSSPPSNAIFSLSTFDFHQVSCPLLRVQQERRGQGKKKKCKKHCLSNFLLLLSDL